jgi:undecaprenyl-diphosphatase
MLWLSAWGWLVAVILVLLTRDKKLIMRTAIALLITWGIASFLKIIVARPRPFVVGDAQLIGPAPHTSSFPSIHASLSFAFATMVHFYRKKLGWVLLVLAVLVSYSRVYLGVHYWSDIITGAVLGAAVAYGTDRMMNQLERSRRKHKR